MAALRREQLRDNTPSEIDWPSPAARKIGIWIYIMRGWTAINIPARLAKRWEEREKGNPCPSQGRRKRAYADSNTDGLFHTNSDPRWRAIE